MIQVSSQHTWLTAELATHIRDVLDPMIEHYSDLAHSIGGDPADQTEKAHHVGRAQGLIDAVEALTAESLPVAAPPEAGHVTADVVRRMRRNRGAHRSGL